MLSVFVKKHDELIAEFEAEKDRVISAWKTRLWVIGASGAVVITLAAIVYYKLGEGADQSIANAIILAAAGEGLWVFLVWVYARLRSDRTSWISKSRRATFELATPKILQETRPIELKSPDDVVELQDRCRTRLAERMTSLVMARAANSRSQGEVLAKEVESIRDAGLKLVGKYRVEWEAGRRIIEALYQESNDKVARFKNVATMFKERTMDRTRELFGHRGAELDGYVRQLEEWRTEVREVQ